jgi:hypothetical protein
LDFVTDCRASVSFDSFHWAPVIKMVSEAAKPAHEPGRADLPVGQDAPQRVPTGFKSPKRELGTATATPEAITEWSAQANFAGPAKPVEKPGLSPWEKFAQVLLLSNELMFVD